MEYLSLGICLNKCQVFRTVGYIAETYRELIKTLHPVIPVEIDNTLLDHNTRYLTPKLYVYCPKGHLHKLKDKVSIDIWLQLQWRINSNPIKFEIDVMEPFHAYGPMNEMEVDIVTTVVFKDKKCKGFDQREPVQLFQNQRYLDPNTIAWASSYIRHKIYDSMLRQSRAGTPRPIETTVSASNEISRQINQMMITVSEPTGLLATATENNSLLLPKITEESETTETSTEDRSKDQIPTDLSLTKDKASGETSASTMEKSAEDQMLEDYHRVVKFKKWLNKQSNPPVEFPKFKEMDPELEELTPEMRANEERKKVKFIIPKKSSDKSDDSIVSVSPLSNLHKKSKPKSSGKPEFVFSALQPSTNTLGRAKQVIKRSRFEDSVRLVVPSGSTLSEAIVAKQAQLSTPPPTRPTSTLR